jgi:hypothetical protein
MLPQTVPAEMARRLTLVAGLQAGQLVGVLLDQVGDPPQDPGPLPARQAGPGPGVEHRPGLGHRRVDVCRAGVRDLGDHFARRRIQDIADGARGGRHP